MKEHSVSSKAGFSDEFRSEIKVEARALKMKRRMKANEEHTKTPGTGTNMGKSFRYNLPSSLRKSARQLIVGIVARVVRFTNDVLNIAVTNGLDLKQELTPYVKESLASVLGALPPAQLNAMQDAAGQPNAPRSLNARDFLFLMDVIAAAANKPEASQKAVRASIIIPVFNQLDYTFQCLQALMREVDLQTDEVIIVNNASEDDTEFVLSHMKGFVRFINNSENKGFVHACNQGAKLARGKHLIFLNNDTMVQAGWLNNLVDTVERDSAIGAVGSMLVYPDGRLQEAGGIVWIDGSGWNYGRGESTEDRRFKFAREVDYCSGASLLVRKEIFECLGGFDERYAPAYYEDADLCFGVRSLGFKVVYQPMSRVMHYEGITAGTDIESGYKQYQEINRSKFVEKWCEVLREEHLENDADQVEIAANRKAGPRVMVFDDMYTSPTRDAGSLRMTIILKILARMGRVVFVPVGSQLLPESEYLLAKEGIEVAHLANYKSILKKGDFQTVILSRPAVGDGLLSTIRKLDRTIKIIYDTVDIHFLRLQREHELTGDESFAAEAALLKKQETRVAAASDQVWCVTNDDKETLEREAPAANVQIIPCIHALHERGATFEERDGLLFIGNFGHRPNKDAVHYFMQKIYPLIREEVPDMKFYIVGSNTPEELRAYQSSNVQVMGYVEDVDSLFHKCRVFVSPLRYGAGMKGKIGQALSYGLPIVTTAIGAEGIGLEHDHSAFVADDAESFAAAVLQIYRSKELWQRLSDSGYKHIEENYTPAIVEAGIHKALAELSRPVKAPFEALPQTLAKVASQL